MLEILLLPRSNSLSLSRCVNSTNRGCPNAFANKCASFKDPITQIPSRVREAKMQNQEGSLGGGTVRRGLSGGACSTIAGHPYRILRGEADGAERSVFAQ